MANNIKIVGNIANVQQVSRYDAADLNLFQSEQLQENFGQQNDYIEYFIYDIGGNLLNLNYDYKSFKLPTTSYLNPINGSLPIIEIDPVKDLQDVGYSSGEFKVQYNLFNTKISNPAQSGLFIKEISSDRTEIRVASTTLSNTQIEDRALNIIDSYNSPYFLDYILNFGNNTQVVVVNTALDKSGISYEILFKLYQPLPDSISEKATFWVVTEKVNPYVFDINLDRITLPPTGSQLRGPNFAIDIPNQNNVATSYQTYDSLISTFKTTAISSSYQQLLSLITSQSIDINTDYTNFDNFIVFSSVKQRIINFYNKVKSIEDYNNSITVYTPLISSNTNVILDYNLATASINDTIGNFDGFEYYLYFESGSTLTSSIEYNITPYPKTGSLLPYNVLNTGSAKVQEWYSWATSSADYYDDQNQNNLIFTLPTFIKDDPNNSQYLTFLNMVGHYFDNIWIYLQAITDINLANNNLEKGISKDLVYDVLESLGTKLYNQYGDVDNLEFLVGNSGSANFDNNFTFTGSYLNTIPRKDLLAESYKRIYHNLPLLLKTRGTSYGLQTLISTFGISNKDHYTILDANGSASYWYTPTGSAITSSILKVKEYGGDEKTSTLDEFNNEKVRIVNTTVVTGSVLSPYISVVQYPTSSDLFRTNDLNYVDISFSPQDKIDIYTSASIVAVNPTWSIDEYIGDPGYLYSSSYATLDIQRNIYLSPLSASNIPFTASSASGSIGATNYNDFIRLIQFFDNSLFKMLQDFVPARTSLSTGVTISSPILERNKWSYANPTPSSKINVNEGTIEGPTISTEYTDIYKALTGSKEAYYDGEFSGSIIEYGDEWIALNYNPYLLPTASLTAGDINIFNHSDFNVLFNNVSQSLLSIHRRILQPIYSGSGLNFAIAGYSSSYFAELQDSYDTLRTHQNSRYDGTKIYSLKYNDYTSASLTYDGDNSYGKTAVIDRNSSKIAIFTEISSSIFLPGRNRVSLKYLVDNKGSLTELNQRNKHWQEVQRTFVAGKYLNVSQFDNQKYSNQKNTDGDKLIFDSGYSYYPILYFASCSIGGGDSKIYFENLGTTTGYTVIAKNGITPYNISGSSSTVIGYPIINSNVNNIFNTETEDNNGVFTPGIELAPPTYSVQESGDYYVQTSFAVSASTFAASDVYLTASLILYKNGTELLRSTDNLNLIATGNTASALPATIYSPPGGNSILNNNGSVTLGRSILIGGTSWPAGTTIYRYTATVFSSSAGSPTCTVSGRFPPEYYSFAPSFGSTLIGCPLPVIYQYNITSNLYEIINPESANLSADNTFLEINRPIAFPISNLNDGDKLNLILNISASNSNFTASLTEGSLRIGSTATSIGYSSTTCPYFSSSSISASLTAGIFNTITFSPGLSNFHNSGYQFVPNPLTGSKSILYPVYGDVDYPFAIKPFDIVLTYLSDNTYVESRVLNVTTSSSDLVQVTLNNELSSLYRNNLMSGSYQRFLVLKRVEDETSTFLTFRKRDGKTSYGFIIPEDLSDTVLDNIDTITREVKQKLLADQQGTTS